MQSSGNENVEVRTVKIGDGSELGALAAEYSKLLEANTQLNELIKIWKDRYMEVFNENTTLQQTNAFLVRKLEEQNKFIEQISISKGTA